MSIKENFKIIKLRQAVSAVVFREDKFLMVVGKDWPEGAWCFPQGGINKDETHLVAITRELKEELGTEKFRVLTKSEIDHMYLFPDKTRRKKEYEGQFQTIWFVEFFGEFDSVTLKTNELLKHQWFDKNAVVENMLYPEQKEVFSRALIELDNLRKNNII